MGYNLRVTLVRRPKLGQHFLSSEGYRSRIAEALPLRGNELVIEIEERQLSPAEKQAQDERQAFQRINELTAVFYRSVLEQRPEGAVAREYLEKRAATGEIAEAYRLGFVFQREPFAPLWLVSQWMMRCG